jgi:hypothetical protein
MAVIFWGVMVWLLRLSTTIQSTSDSDAKEAPRSVAHIYTLVDTVGGAAYGINGDDIDDADNDDDTDVIGRPSSGALSSLGGIDAIILKFVSGFLISRQDLDRFCRRYTSRDGVQLPSSTVMPPVSSANRQSEDVELIPRSW